MNRNNELNFNDDDKVINLRRKLLAGVTDTHYHNTGGRKIYSRSVLMSVRAQK